MPSTQVHIPVPVRNPYFIQRVRQLHTYNSKKIQCQNSDRLKIGPIIYYRNVKNNYTVRNKGVVV